jgi:hypothetical protein
VRGEFAERRQCADLEAVAIHLDMAGQRAKPLDVDQPLGVFEVGLHQGKKVGPSGERP